MPDADDARGGPHEPGDLLTRGSILVDLERVFRGEYCGVTHVDAARVFWCYDHGTRVLFFYGGTDPSWHQRLDAIKAATIQALSEWITDPTTCSVRFRYRL